MADDAVIKLGYDNSKVRAGARETEATMQRTARSVKGNWNETSKKMKDVFDPLSRGALVNAGGVGVAIFGATQAISKFRTTVETLAKAEYLTASQRDQMGHVAAQFQRVDEYIGKIQAKAIAGIFNGLSGGDFDKAVAADAAGQSYQRQAAIIAEITSMEKALAEDQLSSAEKLDARRQEALDIEKQIEAERRKTFDTTDKEAQSQEKMLGLDKQKLVMQKQINDLQKAVAADNKRAADEAQKAAEKQAAIQGKAGDIAGNLAEMKERAGGRDRKADKIARERKISSRAKDIADQLGISQEDATNIATEESNLQDKVSGKRTGVRRSGKARKKTVFDLGFNEFFHDTTSDKQFGRRSSFDQGFNEFFHDKDIVPPKNFTPRNTLNGSKTNTKDPSQDDSRRLLERIAAGIEQITAE